MFGTAMEPDINKRRRGGKNDKLSGAYAPRTREDLPHELRTDVAGGKREKNGSVARADTQASKQGLRNR